MITNNDLQVVNLSATKKDYYQIWNELIDTAKKISERWDPRATNESDPGIVLLKVLTGVNDRLNYNIDKNILEAFMPSAAQYESMKKLCDMLGYNIKYYQSAKTKITLTYNGDMEDLLEDSTESSVSISIPLFSNVTDVDNNINYVVIEANTPFYIDTTGAETNAVEVLGIEGQLAQCETDSDNIITMSQLDEFNRYYLPETQIAENGIFIYRYKDGIKDSSNWTKVDNLNTQETGATVYKFGYDSREGVPYIQFPDDITNIIEDGFEIYYIRTDGINGNVSARTLTTFEVNTSGMDDATKELWDETYSANISAVNKSAATNGCNIQSITNAYQGFKKTIGTFDTLVTCRDYINAIYNLIDDEDNPYVSNIVVADIRDDINRAVTLCSFNDYGICYNEESIKDIDGTNKINHFDLMLYPFQYSKTCTTEKEYNSTFKYTEANKNEIKSQLGSDSYKTLSHQFNYPTSDEIVAIKNYLQLKANITTTAKVNTVAAKIIIENVKLALYDSFNARELDFGEEIPYDSILSVIQNADTNIKNVTLDDPILTTYFVLADGTEHSIGATKITTTTKTEGTKTITVTETVDTTDNIGRAAYNKAVLRNILAGRVELFNYNSDFSTDINEATYGSGYEYNQTDATVSTTEKQDPLEIKESSDDSYYTRMDGICEISVNELSTTDTDKSVKLEENEKVQFRFPSFKTSVTYPAYVNYFVHLNTENHTYKAATPAEFITVLTVLNGGKWETFANYSYSDSDTKLATELTEATDITSQATYTANVTKYGAVFKLEASTYVLTDSYEAGTTYYIINLNTSSNFKCLINCIGDIYVDLYESNKLSGYIPGKLVTSAGHKFRLQTSCNYTPTSGSCYLSKFYQPTTIGEDASVPYIAADSDYQLKEGEYIVFNYTQSSDDSSTSTTSSSSGTVVNKYYLEGQIIKPNFNLYDTATYNSSTEKAYTKTVDPAVEVKLKGGNTTQVNSFYTMDTSEQISIRELVKVYFQEPKSYFYWILNDPTMELGGEKDGDEDVITTYTLQDNEYLFYTNKNKLDLVYYGSGTELTFKNVLLKPSQKTSSVTIEKILEEGLDAIPWVEKELNTTTNNITIQAYQYVTLGENDRLTKVTFIDNGDTKAADIKSILNKPLKIESATYYTNVPSTVTDAELFDPASEYTASTLPASDITINGEKAYWEVYTKLELHMGPSVKQKLTKHDRLELTKNDSTEKEIVKPCKFDNLYIDDCYVYVQSNYLIDVACGWVLLKRAITEDEEADPTFDLNELYYKDFKLKFFFAKSPVNIESQDSWHTAELVNSTSASETKEATFNCLLPKQTAVPTTEEDVYQYGIFMVYTKADMSAITITALSTDGSTEVSCLETFREFCTEITGGKTYAGTTGTTSYTSIKITDNQSVNVIVIKQAALIKLSTSESGATSEVVFSTPDIVNINGTDGSNYYGLNLDVLKYYSLSNQDTIDASAKQLMTDVLPYLHETDKDDYNFYANCYMDNSTKLNINRNYTGENAYKNENMRTPKIWYDYNNMNNKFVISEIDTSTLDDGLQIVASSKL